MRLIALATTGSSGFSAGGTLEVVAAGGLFGALGGFLLWLLPRRLAKWRPVALTGLLFLIVAIISGAARGAASGIAGPPRYAALLAFAGLSYAFALLLARAPWLNCRSPLSPR